MRLLIALAFAFLGAGCRTRLYDGLDGDGGAAPAECTTHRRAPLPLDSLALADDVAPTSVQTLRVRADVTLRASCDQLAGVTVVRQLGNATDSVRVTIELWRDLRAACGQDATLAYLVALPSPQNLAVIVQDGAPGGTAQLLVNPAQVQMPADCTIAGGNTCEGDCQCATGAGCIPPGFCAITCNRDSDCRDPLRPVCVPPIDTQQSGFCASSPGAATTPPPAPSSGKSCACDSDCVRGEVCDADARRCAATI